MRKETRKSRQEEKKRKRKKRKERKKRKKEKRKWATKCGTTERRKERERADEVYTTK